MAVDVRKQGKRSKLWVSVCNGAVEYHKTFADAFIAAWKQNAEKWSEGELGEVTINGAEIAPCNNLDHTASGKVKPC